MLRAQYRLPCTHALEVATCKGFNKTSPPGWVLCALLACWLSLAWIGFGSCWLLGPCWISTWTLPNCGHFGASAFGFWPRVAVHWGLVTLTQLNARSTSNPPPPKFRLGPISKLPLPFPTLNRHRLSLFTYATQALCQSSFSFFFSQPTHLPSRLSHASLNPIVSANL